MRAVPLRELRALIESAPFAAWWGDFWRALAAEREVQARHLAIAAEHRRAELEADLAQRQAVDTFSEAGHADEVAARVGAESQAHEVEALEKVGRFEEQRFRTSDLWYRVGGMERTLEVRREQLTAANRLQQDGEKARTASEAAVRVAERQLKVLQDEYAQEDRKRSRAWDEVESAWEKSFERSLVAAEHSTRARRIIREADQLFREAEEKRARARRFHEQAEEGARLADEAVGSRGALVEDARGRFGCVCGDAFLYWRHPDDPQVAWALALCDDLTGWNLPVRAREVYMVGRVRGAAFLEAAREGLPLSVERGDRRIENYFLGARKTARREGGPSAASSEVEET